MTPGDKAHEIVKAFQEEGHPYYDELLQPIETAIKEAIAAEREACARVAGAKFTEHNNWLKNTDDPTERARALGGSLTAKSIEVLIRGRE